MPNPGSLRGICISVNPRLLPRPGRFSKANRGRLPRMACRRGHTSRTSFTAGLDGLRPYPGAVLLLHRHDEAVHDVTLRSGVLLPMQKSGVGADPARGENSSRWREVEPRMTRMRMALAFETSFLDARALLKETAWATRKKIAFIRQIQGSGGACRRRSIRVVGPPSDELNCLCLMTRRI
jgi:hypothetical protein